MQILRNKTYKKCSSRKNKRQQNYTESLQTGNLGVPPGAQNIAEFKIHASIKFIK